MASRSFIIAVLWLLFRLTVGAERPGPYRYHPLPPLREQARIQDAWTAERRSNIPSLMRKHGVDAWLVTVSRAFCLGPED